MVAVKTAQVSDATMNRASFWTRVSVLLDWRGVAPEVFSETFAVALRHDYCASGRVFRQGATCDDTESAAADRDHTLIRASV